jgi:peroxiredoxin
MFTIPDSLNLMKEYPMTALTQNQTAPAFSVPDQNGDIISLTDYAGKQNVVLYFYPKDDTPGCTIEANDFTALASDFSAADTVVLGVSKDDCASHQAFIDKFGLKVSLLADTDGTLCEAYDVWREKVRDGVTKMAILRSTFIINKAGNLSEALYGVNHEGHAQDMLNKVKVL